MSQQLFKTDPSKNIILDFLETNAEKKKNIIYLINVRLKNPN